MLKTNSSKNNVKVDDFLGLIFNETNNYTVVLLDSLGNVKSWNNSAHTLTGFTKEDVIHKNYFNFLKKDKSTKKIKSNFTKTIFKKKSFKFVDKFIKKDGTFFWADHTLNPIITENSNQINFVLLLQDITDKMENERQKEEYLSIASHELKTPVTALSLYSELLSDRLHLMGDKKSLQMLNDVQSQVKRLLNLVDGLLVMNEAERKKLSVNKVPFDLNKMIKKVIYDFKGTTTTHKLIYKSKIKKMVFGDEHRIVQVLVNLVANGIKYSSSADKIIIDAKIKKNKVIISVRDFGSGISLKEQKNIFRPFFRSYALERGNIPGLGLGLYISKEIIKKHNEKMWVVSRKGKGSVFSFSLSIARKN